MSRLSIIDPSSSEDCVENSPNFMLETNKKTKLNMFRCSSEEEQAYSHVNDRDCEPNSNQDESSREAALRNPIILQNILKHFTTNFLLSSCSLVNKTWNKAARIFIRNSRKCVASNPHHNSSPSTCQLLQDLRNLCCKIRGEGRQVPFNGLKVELLQLTLNERCPKGSGCDHQVEHINLPSEMELKYLEITCSSTEVLSSRIQDASASLIRNHASQVKYLTAQQSILRLGEIIRHGNPPPVAFPKLEEITISPTELQYKTLEKDILTSIFATSPNLTKVFVDDRGGWEIVPQEYYGLLVNLEMYGEDIFDEASRLAEIVCKKPKLRELTFNEFVSEEDAPPPERFKHFLTELLTHCCQESLEYFYITNYTFHTLTLLSHIPLKNLSNLTLEMNDDGSRLEEFRNALASIQVDKMMPKLEKVELKLHLDDIREWPANNPGQQVGYGYSSVPKLTLDFTHVTVNLAEIQALFPNVISLEVVLERSEYVPCREFWELWPNLEVLTVNGMVNTLGKNYDADFCGISEEEAELLRGMDDDYLRTVHIVPIRPSLLTMPHLRTILIDFHFTEDAINSSRNSLDFISIVTELVALRQISHKNAAITWVCQYRNNENSEGSRDSDDEEEEDASHDDNSEDYVDDDSGGDDDSDDGNGAAKDE